MKSGPLIAYIIHTLISESYSIIALKHLYLYLYTCWKSLNYYEILSISFISNLNILRF